MSYFGFLGVLSHNGLVENLCLSYEMVMAVKEDNLVSTLIIFSSFIIIDSQTELV